MRRRDISRALLATVTATGAAALARRADAQSCAAPCYPITAAESGAAVTPVNTAYLPGDIRRYGAVVDGATDDSAAIRSALDAVPAGGGRIFCDPPGVIMVGSVVYIPQRISGFGGAGGTGTVLDFPGSTFDGNGGRIFESGTGQYSTVSKGGASNFGQPSESATSMHIGDRIQGATFRNYSIALKLFNFLSGCALNDLKSWSPGTFGYIDRCFYLAWNSVNINANGQSSGMPLIDFYDISNTMTFNNVHVGGGTSATGIGYRFNGSISGCFLTGLGAEDLTIGYDFLSELLGVVFTGNYSENCGTSISLGALSDALVIEGNYFNSNATVITGNNWTSGRWGINHYDGAGNAVNLSGTGNLCEVWVHPRQYTEAGGGNPHTGWTALPSGWSVNNGCYIRYTDYIYNDTLGYVSTIAALHSYTTGGGQIPKAYTGTLNTLHSGQVPFCTVTVSGTTAAVDTNIIFDPHGGGIEFDVEIQDNVAVFDIAGRTYGGTSVFRYDSTGKTVTVSNNGGMFRFTFTGFSVACQVNGGEIRIV